MSSLLMNPLVVVGALLLAVGVFFYIRRLSERRELLERLDRLRTRLQRPFPNALQARQSQVQRSILQLIDQVRSGAAGRLEVEHQLPRLTQNLVRLEQDLQRLKDSEAVQQTLMDWVARLELHPKGSELADLRQVAQNALRIALGLVEEGALERAREVAQEANTLISRQHEALESSSKRLKELVVRIDQLSNAASACNAPILVRAQWERASRLKTELQAPLKEGRPSDALVLATRLVTHLDQLHQDLLDQLNRQVKELRAQAGNLLNELLIWPPTHEQGRARVQTALRVVEPAGQGEPRTLREASTALEAAQEALSTGQTLASAHTEAWRSHILSLKQRFNLQVLSLRLKTFKSLPESLLEELQGLKRLRNHVERRLELELGWQLADQLVEVLEHEEAVVARLEQLVIGLTQKLSALQEGVEQLAHFGPQVGLEPRRLQRIEQQLTLLQQKLERKDVATLDREIQACAEALRSTVEECRARGLETAQQASLAIRQALDTLEKEGLESYVASEVQELKSVQEKLNRAIEQQEVLQALRWSEPQGRHAPRLVETALWRRAEQKFAELQTRLVLPPELVWLAGEQQFEFNQEFESLVERLTQLRRSAPRAEVLEKGVASLSGDVNWLMLRIRKELSRQFQQGVNRHKELMERLGKGTVQFYLPEGAIELLAQGRKLQAEAQASLGPNAIGNFEKMEALAEHSTLLEQLWVDSLPRARRFYERQLGTLEVELFEVDASDLPEGVRSHRKTLEARIARILDALQGEGWEEELKQIEPLGAEVRVWIQEAEATRSIGRWWNAQGEGVRARLESLAAAGCQREETALRSAIQALEQGLASPQAHQDLQSLEKAVRAQVVAADAALQQALEDVERTRAEQDQIGRWEQILQSRKQDLDWLRTCLKGVMVPGPEGLDLKDGLERLQALGRALEPIGLDLEGASRQDNLFRQWVLGVRSRAEVQFRREFKEVLESLHDAPSDTKSLCAEALAHIDAVLGAQYADAAERERYHQLQRRGDAFHRLFGKRLSVKS